MGEPEWNRQPDRLYAPQRYILAMGGKRLRPILALMGAEAVGAKAELALPAAHAVERFQSGIQAGIRRPRAFETRGRRGGW